MALDNDARGWIMTCISGIACVIGAAFICVDVVVRLFPSKRNFQIQDSDGFLSCSLSLSAGVMLFSALYTMLPSSKRSLQDGGASPRAAAWILIACFLGGVFGIQIFSRAIHHFMPSKAVDCDHTHDDATSASHVHEHEHKHSNSHKHPQNSSRPQHQTHDDAHTNHSDAEPSEQTPLLSRSATISTPADSEGTEIIHKNKAVVEIPRPSLQARITGSFANIVLPSKRSCDAGGPCYGYSDPCGKDCFKKISLRGGVKGPEMKNKSGPRPLLRHSMSTTANNVDGRFNEDAPGTMAGSQTNTEDGFLPLVQSDGAEGGSSSTDRHAHPDDSDYQYANGNSKDVEAAIPSPQHHHHIPKNAFLSISVQTSIAIALHKLPEGFITYATNHANPKLGVSVFLAIGVHNLSEGFALALPIYLATQSRLKALVLAIILGGLSQPVGAGVAAAWLKIAERNRGSGAEQGISDGAYGGMFAVTAGIMASVALSLLQESFELSHNKNYCMAFAFIGMGILGISSALTA